MRLKDKVAIVTGGGSGIGRGICREFARQGAIVVVVDIDAAKAKEVAAEIAGDSAGAEPLAIEADVTDERATAHMAAACLERHGRVDVLVNNAGARVMKPFVEHTLDDWRRMLDINLTGPFLCSRAVVPGMLKAGKGSIVNLASIASFMGRPDRVAYVAAKTGVLGLTRAMAVDFANTGVRVNAIAPGMVATPFNAMFAEDPSVGPEWARENYVGRWGRPEDVAMAAVFLASDESEFVTGAEIKVDGGWLAAKTRVGELKA